MEYFNLLDTPVWNYDSKFTKTSSGGGIRVELGGDQNRWLIAHMFIAGTVFSVGNSFDFDAYLINYGIGGSLSRTFYNYFADGEEFTYGTNTTTYYLQYPMTPNVVVSGKHKGAHPTTSNLILVPNGDTLRLYASNMNVNDSFRVIIKAYTRHKIPDLLVSTLGGGGTDVTEYHSYLR